MANEIKHVESLGSVSRGMTSSPMRSNNEAAEDEIDLVALFMALLDHIWIIVAATIICATIVGAYSVFKIAPTYSATTKLYVVSASGDSVVDLTDLNIGTSLTDDYKELLTSYPVVFSVIDKMDLPYSREELLKKIDISNPAKTRILNITVTNTDPILARDIANTYAEVAIDYLPKTMSTNPPNIAQKAILPEHKVGPSNSKNTILGAMVGFVISCGFFVIQFLMDDTFHTSEDIENYLGIVPLAVVPESGSSEGKKRSKKRRR